MQQKHLPFFSGVTTESQSLYSISGLVWHYRASKTSRRTRNWHLDEGLFPFFSPCIWPHLDSLFSFGPPQHKTDVDKLGWVQHWAPRCRGPGWSTYGERRGWGSEAGSASGEVTSEGTQQLPASTMRGHQEEPWGSAVVPGSRRGRKLREETFHPCTRRNLLTCRQRHGSCRAAAHPPCAPGRFQNPTGHGPEQTGSELRADPARGSLQPELHCDPLMITDYSAFCLIQLLEGRRGVCSWLRPPAAPPWAWPLNGIVRYILSRLKSRLHIIFLYICEHKLTFFFFSIIKDVGVYNSQEHISIPNASIIRLYFSLPIYVKSILGKYRNFL